MTTLGYLSAFDGVTLVNGTTSKVPIGEAPIGDTNLVIERIHTLANGTEIDYDGSSSSDLAYGEVAQVIRVTSGVTGYNTNMAAKKGEVGTLTKTKFTGGTETCTARCLDAHPLPNSLPGIDIMYFYVRFKCQSAWS